MRMVIDNVKSEHYNLLAEMARTLNFTVVEVELTEDEEDAELLAAMEEVKDEPALTGAEALEFRKWLDSAAK